MTIEAQRTAMLKRDLTHLLERKRALHIKNVSTPFSRTDADEWIGWLVDAVALLLRHELEQL